MGCREENLLDELIKEGYIVLKKDPMIMTPARPGHKNRKPNTETEKTGTETEKTGTDQTVIFFGYHSSETEI